MMENNNNKAVATPIITEITDLADKNLNEFKITEMFEVYRHDPDRTVRGSLGFFWTIEAAKEFAKIQTLGTWHQVKAGFVLTGGEVGFRIYDEKPVVIHHG